jgi:hypothetical protein
MKHNVLNKCVTLHTLYTKQEIRFVLRKLIKKNKFLSHFKILHPL